MLGTKVVVPLEQLDYPNKVQLFSFHCVRVVEDVRLLYVSVQRYRLSDWLEFLVIKDGRSRYKAGWE